MPNNPLLQPGDRVSITEQKHPYVGHAGELIAFETYGLGWTGWRVNLDGNHGETYANPDELMGPGRVDSIRMTGYRRVVRHLRKQAEKDAVEHVQRSEVKAMTIRELATRRVQQCGMNPREAALMLEGFARTQEGSIIGWGDIAPGLSRDLAERIDRAAVGYRMRNGVPRAPEPNEPYDGKMRATGEAI